MQSVKERVDYYLTASAKAKTKKKVALKKATKQGAAKHPGEYYAKLDKKLGAVAKKHGVKINVRKNKKKLPVAVVTGLKNMPFSKAVEVFNSISHSSPVPQKMNANGASFRLFGKPGTKKMTAFDSQEPQFIVTGKTLKGRVYYTEAGEFKPSVGAHDIAIMDEESADKVLRRLKNKLPGITDMEVVSRNVIDKNLTADDMEDVSDDTEEDYSEDEEDDASDDDFDSRVSDAVAKAEQYGVSPADLNGLVDKAIQQYSSDLKSGDSSLEDRLSFICDILDPETVDGFFNTYANKASL